MPLREGLVETVARVIARADERNGSSPYEARVAMKHVKDQLFDEAEAVVAMLESKVEKRDKKQYWVLCGNDFPSAVYDSEEKAEAAKERLSGTKPAFARIYWHIHVFDLNKEPAG